MRQSPSIQRRLQRSSSSSSSPPFVHTNRNENKRTLIWRGSSINKRLALSGSHINTTTIRSSPKSNEGEDCVSVASKYSPLVSLSQEGTSVPVDIICGTRNEKWESGSNESNTPSSSSGTANALHGATNNTNTQNRRQQHPPSTSKPPRPPTPSPRPPQSSSSSSVPTIIIIRTL